MARPKAKAPALRYHLSGQSVVTIDGRDFYLGKHDSPESIARYAVLIGIYQKHGLKLPEDFELAMIEQMAETLMGIVSPAATTQPTGPVTVAHVTAAYREHLKTKYRNSPQDQQRFERLCDILDEHHGSIPVDDFGPLRLSKVRDSLLSQGLQKPGAKTTGGKPRQPKLPSRSYANRLVRFVIAIFSYGVSQELVRLRRSTSCGPLSL